MHAECYRFVERMARLLGPRRSVLEIGSRNVNGSVRPLFAGAEYVGLDARPGPGVDVVADAANWRGSMFDTVVCTEVLEHARNAPGICQTAYHSLKDGGVLLLTAAGASRPPHGADGGPVGAEWYANVNESQLRDWLRPFVTVLIEIDDVAHDIRALAVK